MGSERLERLLRSRLALPDLLIVRFAPPFAGPFALPLASRLRLLPLSEQSVGDQLTRIFCGS